MRLSGRTGDPSRTPWWRFKASIARPFAPRGLVHQLQRSERLTVWTLLAMLLMSIVTAGYLLVASEPRVAHLTDLTRESRITLSLALEQQADLYEWLANGDETMQGRFQETAAALSDMHDDLLRSAGSSDISADIVAIVLAHGAWQAWAQDTFRSLSDRELASGDLTAVLAEGDRLFATYRATQAASTDFLAAERDDALTSQQHVITALLAATVAMLGAAAIFAVRRSRRLRDTVEAPLVHLLDTIGSLRTGNLSVRLVPSGVDARLDRCGTGRARLQPAGGGR
jgi:hypothetical protein